jgi:hypothetical protein
MNKLNIVAASWLGNPHRVNYHTQYVESCLRQNNFDKINFIFFYEPESQVQSFLKKLSIYENFDLKINPYRFGANLNHFICLNYCFENLKLDHVLMSEDDVEFSNDVYDIVNFYINSKYYDDNNIFSLLNKENFIKNLIYKENDHEVVEIKNFMNDGIDFFNSCGWLVTKRVWTEVLKYWDKKRSYDWEIVEKYKTDTSIIVPKESRVKHIGEFGINYNEKYYEAHGWKNYSLKKYNNNINYKFVNCI